MRLPQFAVQRPMAILMLFGAVLLLGVFSLRLIPVDLYPEVEPPVVSILTTWPGASAADVEEEVTRIIENWVNGANNLDTLTSISQDNLSVISCRFAWGTDLDTAMNDLRAKLELARRKLPADIQSPILFKFSSSTAPIMFLTITGPKSWQRLYHLVDKELGDELRRVPGVGATIIYGGMRRRINVYFDRAKLEAYGLSISRISQVLAAQNRNLPAGSVKQGRLEFFVRVPGRYTSITELKRTVIGSHRGHPVRLADVATVRDYFKPLAMYGWSNRKPSIVLLLQKQSGQNTVAVANAVRERLKRIKPRLPADVEIKVVLNAARGIEKSILNLRTSLLLGIGLVILVTVIFLRQFKSSLVVALTIPFSLILSFILMFLMGYSINTITLMSLAIASGMVVDNAIVVLENVVRRVDAGGRPGPAAVFGASEMGLAITASTMTTVVIFLPMVFLSGLVGVIFKQLAFVVTVTLLASLFTSLSMTPMLASRWVRPPAERRAGRRAWMARLDAAMERRLTGLENAYGRLVDWALDHRGVVLALVGLAALSAVTMLPMISTSFMPQVDSGDVSVDFRLEEGTHIEETKRVVEGIIDDVLKVVKPEEFRSLYAWCGNTEEGIGVALGVSEAANAGQVGFKLVDPTKRRRSAKEIAARLRQRLSKVPGIISLSVLAADPAGALISGRQRPVVVEVSGPDLAVNLALAQRLAAAMGKLRGLASVSISQKAPRPELRVAVDRDKASLLGLTVGEVALQVRNYLYGFEASEYREGGDSHPIFTRLDRRDKNDIASLPLLPIFTRDGRKVRLGEVAAISETQGPVEIERKNMQRVVRVEADLDGVSLGQATAAVRRLIAEMDPPPGVSLGFGGDIKEQRQAFKDLSILLVLGIVLVYMIMAALFGNLRDPLIIMAAVPFAFVGVIYALRLTGTSLGVIPFMGVVMLMGIVVNNAIVLLDYTHLLRQRGLGLRQAVVTAGRQRLRPVLMTTATTFFAMLPMAMSDAQGAEVWNPLGVTVLGGLAVSALVTLLLIPVVYYLVENRRLRRAGS